MSPPNTNSTVASGSYTPHAGLLASPDTTRAPVSDLAVVIPTQNNELVIGSLVLLARRYAAHVIVADDGSTDQTVAVAGEVGADVVLAASRPGRVNAILAGCRRAVETGAWAVVLLDPHANHLTRDIPSLAAPVLAGDTDLAIGSRTLTARKHLYTAGSDARTDAPSASTDPSSTFRVLGPRALDLLDFIPDDADFETVLTALVTRRGLVVTEQPVTLRNAAAARDADNLPLYRGHRVAVVMPAHNEELLIGETLSGIPDYIARVYVINDCSTDNTREVVEAYAARDPSITLINHETNSGPGGAIRNGFKAALKDGMEVVATMDGDNQMDPHFLPQLLDPIIDGKCDYTKGNRLSSAAYRTGMSSWRFFGNATLTLLTKFASGYWQLTDPQNGYTAISARALERIDIDGIYPRYGYLNDILVKLNVLGFRVVNVPHPSRYGRETSSIKYHTYIVRVSRLLLHDFLWRLKTKYVVMSFHPLVFYYFLGVLLIATSLLIGVYALWYRFIEHHPIFVPATVALIVFALGTHYWLFAMLFDMRQERENNGWY